MINIVRPTQSSVENTLKNAVFFGKKGLLFIIALILITSVFFSSWYLLTSGNEAVIQRFGKFHEIVGDGGLHFKLPFIDTVTKIDVSTIHRIEYGFSSEDVSKDDIKNGKKYTVIPSEAQMLTKDENIAMVDAIVQYRIHNSKDYLFNVDDPIGTLKVVAQSAIRRSIANHTLDEAMVSSKFEIQNESREYLQQICDKYNLGVTVAAIQLQDVMPPTEVDAAFKDVASAMEDKSSEINKATSYKNEKIPVARGNAQKVINDAAAYKNARIARARGDVANFQSVLKEYKNGPQVTRTRMYLETMEKILPGVNKFITKDDGSGTLKFLPLQEYAKTK